MRRFLKRRSRRMWSCSCRRCVSRLAFAFAALAGYEADDRASPRFAQGVRLLPNPCQFSINEVAFGVASVDVLWALKSQEFFRKCGDAEPLKEGEKEDPGAKDVMARVGRHLLRQRRCVHVVSFSLLYLPFCRRSRTDAPPPNVRTASTPFSPPLPARRCSTRSTSTSRTTTSRAWARTTEDRILSLRRRFRSTLRGRVGVSSSFPSQHFFLLLFHLYFSSNLHRLLLVLTFASPCLPHLSLLSRLSLPRSTDRRLNNPPQPLLPHQILRPRLSRHLRPPHHPPDGPI
jgi:hypothetical protein